ncbi:MAG TPA: hypothetical protein P5323_01475 [Candidatus Moranbacteria bacterium]|nr:hypothetical protein [Candidatus Pacearchaeota archaeon]HRY27784.1 hypothetical protein [Candidatus Moranbacteria bacterium]HSA08137.1 hypothetical protein [Candidatus Moranbacteria bacterium]
MREKFELYNKEGRVENPEVAKEMAETQKPFREKKILGLFKDKKAIEFGEQLSESIGEHHIKKLNEEQDLKEIAESVKSLEFFDGGVNIVTKEHQLEILGGIYECHLPPRGRRALGFKGISGKIDGNELSNDDLKKIIRKFSAYIVNEAGDEKIKEALNRNKLEEEKKEEQKKLELEKQEELERMEIEKQKETQRFEQKRQSELSEHNKQSVEDILK